MVDSEIGKEDVLDCYRDFGITPDMIKVLPVIPASDLPTDLSSDDQQQILIQHNIPKNYFFYPAQFWQHKNHQRVIEAFARVRNETKSDIKFVLTGGYPGNDYYKAEVYKRLLDTIKRLQIGDHILYLGYVSPAVLSCLYSHAIALVMPTFFGPTNIPILEAWQFECPVITSNIRGVKEQAGDAAILVDPKSIDSISEAMERLWNDTKHSTDLVKLGKSRRKIFTKYDFQKRLTDIVFEASDRVKKGAFRKYPFAEIID
jgi:glycosyltransferase involved in cell wall biosynthesis